LIDPAAPVTVAMSPPSLAFAESYRPPVLKAGSAESKLSTTTPPLMLIVPLATIPFLKNAFGPTVTRIVRGGRYCGERGMRT